MSSFYVTTPIYYVNGSPHIGHAYTTIVADAFARHYRQRGDDVFFLTGTDEHGLKVQRAAEEQGMSPEEMVDQNSAEFRELFDMMELTYDRFIRTTEDEHEEVVLDVLERMKENGDVYLDEYEGWYAASDEAYYDEDEIEDGRAIETGSEVEWVEEESYFFRLSDYEDDLLEWYENAPEAVAPEARLNEVRSFVEGGLEDLSISRTTFDWGIEMPDDPEHVLYVWVDALTNYLTGVGRLHDEETFDKFWPCDIHLIGKDILRFHAVYWPAFLMSAGIELPKQVYAHGWWTVEGEKMSKSKGNWVDAFDLVETYDLDVLRYFLLREIPLGQDGNFAKRRIVERNNSELADNFGNLVNRTTGMIGSFLDGTLEARPETDAEIDADLRERTRELRDRICEQMDARESDAALDTVMDLSSALNHYLQETQPWSIDADEERERLEAVLYHTLEGIRWTTVLAAAFIPKAADTVLEEVFGLDPDEARAYDTLEWGRLSGHIEVGQPDVLFEKLEYEPDEDEARRDLSGEATSDDEADDTDTDDETPDEETNVSDEKVPFDAFTQLEFRVGRIESAEPVEGADTLLELSVDIGDDENRTAVAGVATSFEPEELEGVHATFATNLEPAELFGIESNAMLLAAEVDEGEFEIATFDDSVPPGTSIS